MATPSGGLRIVVLANLVRSPVGGMTWSKLQYLLGLQALGHDVFYMEDSDDYPACYDPGRDEFGTDPSCGLLSAACSLEFIGAGERWAYHDAHRGEWCGPAGSRARKIVRSADVLLNLGGFSTPFREWMADVPHRVFVDRDPVFTQVRNLTVESDRTRCDPYTSFLSLGENIGFGSDVPDDGYPWLPTRQPVHLESVQATPAPRDGRFTTIMLWDSYPALSYEGVTYGMKSDSFASLLNLPRTDVPELELAVGASAETRRVLEAAGWRVVDGREPSRDVSAYQAYIRGSRGEFSVAKQGYVVSRCGWFSERSVAYLASGRPVVVQDTGFSHWLAADEGVLPFSSLDEAIAALIDAEQGNARHCAAARAVAEEYFDAGQVLTDLLERALGSSAAVSTVSTGLTREDP